MSSTSALTSTTLATLAAIQSQQKPKSTAATALPAASGTSQADQGSFASVMQKTVAQAVPSTERTFQTKFGPISTSQIKAYFATNPGKNAVNAKADQLGINQGQLTEMYNAVGLSGLYTKQGVAVTTKQIKDFYASGAGATPFSQGMSDDTQLAKDYGWSNEDVQNARRIGGGIGIYTDPNQYDQFVIYCRGGVAMAGNPQGFQEWRALQSPLALAQMQAGKQTGGANAMT
jgi:hypothetical protein